MLNCTITIQWPHSFVLIGSEIEKEFLSCILAHPELFFIAIPNIVFFPIPASLPKFWRILLPGQQSKPCIQEPILYPVNVSRIPHCILVKSRVSGIPVPDPFLSYEVVIAHSDLQNSLQTCIKSTSRVSQRGKRAFLRCEAAKQATKSREVEAY